MLLAVYLQPRLQIVPAAEIEQRFAERHGLRAEESPVMMVEVAGVSADGE